jgi:acetyl esterase
LILLAQNDITRHSAQAYARKLAGAGVQVSAVRYNGMIHDFGLINALAELPQTRAAVTQIAATLSEYLKPV